MRFIRDIKNKIKNKDTLKIFFTLTAVGRFLLLLFHVIIVIINVSFFDYINDSQCVFFDNWLVDYYEILCFIIFTSFGLYFYVYGGFWLVLQRLKKFLLWINVLVLGITFYLDYLHEKAFDEILVIIPIIGLAIIKTKWTEEQLQIFFEKFQKEIEYIFTDDEKSKLIEKSLNPKDLKENMVEEALEKLAKETSKKELLVKFLWFMGFLTVGLCLSLYMHNYIDIDSNVAVDITKTARYAAIDRRSRFMPTVDECIRRIKITTGIDL